MKKHNVTLAICTYNRLPLLKKCLSEVLKLNYTNMPVVVVNNSSSDGTRKYLESLSGISVYLEEKVGLSHARNLAIQKCSTKYIAFIDDDAYPDQDYFYQLKNLCQKEFDISGGSQVPYSDVRLPDWYTKHTHNAHGYLSGFNIVFKTQRIEALGGFNPVLGMSGKKIAYGEEVLPQVLIKKKGGIISFKPEMKVYHYIQSERLTWKWQMKSSFAHGRDRWTLLDLPPPTFRDLLYLIRKFIAVLFIPKIRIHNLRQTAFKLGEIMGGITKNSKRFNPNRISEPSFQTK